MIFLRCIPFSLNVLFLLLPPCWDNFDWAGLVLNCDRTVSSRWPGSICHIRKIQGGILRIPIRRWSQDLSKGQGERKEKLSQERWREREREPTLFIVGLLFINPSPGVDYWAWTAMHGLINLCQVGGPDG